jgi:hypothetical protein
MMRKGYLFLLVFFINDIVQAQFSLSAPYSQDFDGLGTGTSTSVTGGSLNIINASLNGWYFFESGGSGNTTITAGTGSDNTGDTYNFGNAGIPADRALGGLQSGSVNPTIGFYATNNTGSTITSLTISYTGEQWRLGTAGRVDRLDFQYSLNATSLTTGIWVDANALDFTAPVTTAPTGLLDGNLPANRISITSTIIGLLIPNNATFFIRWNDFNASGAEDGLGIDDLNITTNSTPASTDQFRSFATTGNWDNPTTWESSSDGGITWINATTIPTSAANTVTIRNLHTVTFASFLPIDQVIIQSGGTLNFSNGIMTINDGVGTDVDIQTGGVFVLSSANNPPAFGSGSPTVNVGSGGILRVSASGLTTTAGAGVHAANYVYMHQSVLEHTLTSAFGTVGVTYFPNANPTTIPVFRITQNIGLPVGSTSNTVINGVFEANGNVTFDNSGTKTFRNGIIGSGNINGSTSGKFIINGTAASILGGSGSLTVPTTGGLEIGTATNLVLTASSKTVTGDVSLAGPNSTIELNLSNLFVTGNISGGSSTSYVNTNNTGMLTLTGITTSKTFPIGNAPTGSYNPLVISTTSGADYSARVGVAINPAISFPTYGINRTWSIKASVTSNATVAFQYTTGDANPGVLPSENMEILMNDGPPTNVWSIIPGNNSVTPIGTDPWLVTSTTPLTINNSIQPTPYALGKKGGWILPLDCIISCEAQKINNKGVITFDINSCAGVNSFEIQRSANGISFETIATIPPDITQIKFSYTDPLLAKGINQYRIKVNRQSGAIKYSNTVAIINDTKGLLITSVAPNPVHNQAAITISAAKQNRASFQMYTLSGRLVKQWQSNLGEGTNYIHIDATELPSGIYQLLVSGMEDKTAFRFVKQ